MLRLVLLALVALAVAEPGNFGYGNGFGYGHGHGYGHAGVAAGFGYGAGHRFAGEDNAARQAYTNKIAASLGSGTGTAYLHGVPGTYLARNYGHGNNGYRGGHY